MIAILGEYDALPGLSQKLYRIKFQMILVQDMLVDTIYSELPRQLLQSALKSILKIPLLKEQFVFMDARPKKEGREKYMTRAGLFNDVDVALHWHADDENSANPRPALANKSAKFRFYGRSALLRVHLKKADRL